MSDLVDHSTMQSGTYPHITVTPNWTIVVDITAVKVSNVSLSATEHHIREFFSFSGDIGYIEMQRESESSQIAYVTFKDTQGAHTAVLLSGATIVDRPVSVKLAENYQLPPEAYKSIAVEEKPSAAGAAVKKTEDVMSSMLARGFVLGKDALQRAKSFDERHGLTSNASAKVASLDRRMGLSEKVREVDEWFQVSHMTRSAFAAAEQKASTAGSAILSNSYVSTGMSWIATALSKVLNAAGEVSLMTREKMFKAEEDKKDIISRERKGMFHLDEPPILPVTNRRLTDV